MRIEEFLRPELICCRVSHKDRVAVLKTLINQVRIYRTVVDPTEVLEALFRRERVGPMSLGRGLALCHVRTEKVQDLTVALATCPEGVGDFGTPDGQPVRIVILLLIPKKHTDLYLRVMAAMMSALSNPDAVERMVAAVTPEEVITAFKPDESDQERGEVLALLSQEGALTGRVAQLVSEMPPPELADLIEDLTPSARARCLQAIDPRKAAEVTRHMHIVPITATLRRLTPEAAARILSNVPSSRCVDLLQRLRPEEQAAIMGPLVDHGRREVQTLLKYPAHTAGGLMTPDVLSVSPDTSVANALKAAAVFKDRRQTDVYVVTTEGRLMGHCVIHDLLAADPDRRIGDIMDRSLHAVEPERDQEELRRLVSQNNLQSLPVVGKHGILLGVVTKDDLLDVVEHEANEDMHLMVGTKVVHPLHTPMMVRFRMRLPWILLTLAGELFIALVITKIFRTTLEKTAILAAFLPAITATGGNVGLQATATIIRGLGMGTLKPRHTMQIIVGEVRLGFILGLICGALAATVAYLINWDYHDVTKVSMAVFLAMTSATLATSMVGTLEPLILYRLKFDPATACGPFVTVFNDMFGSLVYMLIATLLNLSPSAPS